MEQKKQRDSNIELFRIITMLLIVAHHYVVNSGLMEILSKDPTNAKSLIYLVFGAWGKTGINCFVLITGYFMCRSNLTLRKYLKLLLEVYFYRFVIFALFLVFGRQTFSVSKILMMLLPFSSITDGFTSCFLAFYLFIPFLNLAINAMNRKQHGLLVCLLLLVYTVLATIPKVHVAFNYVTWFIVLYFVGSYLRLYPVKWVENHAGRKLLVTIVLAVSSFVLLVFYVKRSGRELYTAYYLISDSNKPFALLIAVFAFSFFRQLNLGYHSWINTLASTTFGVLLIHAHSDDMRAWLWGDLLKNGSMYYNQWWILHALLSVLAVFCGCSFLDYLRIRLIEQPFFRLYDQHEAQILQSGRKLLQRAKSYVNRWGN